VQTPAGISFRIVASGLPPGVHGIHVHAVGRCDPPDFTTAGAHWNPAERKHGFENPQGHHAGDLPNVTVGANGVLHTSVLLPNAMLAGPAGAAAALTDADGAALVIHAGPDDYRTDPSGNSGGRIACAVIAPPVPVP
jgi:Cu-Zn family superoxide dismutase